jgi:protein disulfide-isomerase
MRKKMTIKKLFALGLALICSATMAAATLPYDEKADAGADLNKALAEASAQHKKVLVVFGANWCPDCRELDKSLHGKSAPLIDSKFVVVKVDVGHFDKNQEIANAYGNPIKKGIPAAVLLSAKNDVLYATKGGELSNARKMSDQGIYDFFNDVVAKNP